MEKAEIDALQEHFNKLEPKFWAMRNALVDWEALRAHWAQMRVETKGCPTCGATTNPGSMQAGSWPAPKPSGPGPGETGSLKESS